MKQVLKAGLVHRCRLCILNSGRQLCLVLQWFLHTLNLHAVLEVTAAKPRVLSPNIPGVQPHVAPLKVNLQT